MILQNKNSDNLVSAYRIGDNALNVNESIMVALMVLSKRFSKKTNLSTIKKKKIVIKKLGFITNLVS